MKKRLLSALLVAALLLATIPGAFAAKDWIAAEHAKDNGSPYYIMVNRAQNTVTIYALDKNGYYTIPYKAMVCSTGKGENATPTGTFSITGDKKVWRLMMGDVYSQYSSRFNGGILFHSICYREADPSTLKYDQYNRLGNEASHGCVRLQVIDAKWIYDNCPAGTKVTVYNGTTPGALGKPKTLMGSISSAQNNGWEPSDPRTANPWRGRFLLEVSLNKTSLQLASGETATLTASFNPSNFKLQNKTTWTSNNPDVATVDANGRVVAKNAGKARITVANGDVKTDCIVTVDGSLLPFRDTTPGAWYYSAVRYAYDQGMLKGTGDGTFSPDAAVNRAMAVQLIYNLAGNPSLAEPAPETPPAETPDTPDTPEEGGEQAAPAEGTGEETPGDTGEEAAPPDGSQEDAGTEQSPGEQAAAEQAAAEQAAAEKAAAEKAAAEAAAPKNWYDDALTWSVRNGIVDGMPVSGFQPNRAVTRQEFAVMLYRFETLKYGTASPQTADLRSFKDANSVFAFAEDAFSWAVANGVLQGTDSKELRPTATMSRAELSAILRNYAAVKHG